MVHDTPLRPLHEAYSRAAAGAGTHAGGVDRPGAATGTKAPAQIEYMTYGAGDLHESGDCQIVATFGEVEAEYAAIRRGAGLLDSPHRGTLIVRGGDRLEFLNRMLTQELKDMGAGKSRAAFWLNRKGRIDADLLLIELGDRMVIDLDIHQAAHTVKTLAEFIIAEEVEIVDASAVHHHIAVHGKSASGVIAAACGDPDFALPPLSAAALTIADAEVVIARRDQTGQIGYELIMPYEQAGAVWSALLDPVHQSQNRVRPIGWHAFNIARIEAGTPLFNIDFGSTNLPHETGLLRERVSFTKGCYLGQEVVARMESRGHSKSQLVGVKPQSDWLPVAGAGVFQKTSDGSMGDSVGVITSSTLSPMLGAQPVAFAMLKTASAKPGTAVQVEAEGRLVEAIARPLRFWPAENASLPGSDE